MLYRVKQFVWAVTAKLTPEEEQWIRTYLTDKEEQLFGQLKVYEQKHSVTVAREAAKHYNVQNKEQFIRMSLLHDIGKIVYPIGPIRKSVMVLLDKFTKGKVSKYTFMKMVRCYYQHPELGYQLLKEKGEYDEAFLLGIRNHHLQESDTDSEALKLIREWDSKL